MILSRVMVKAKKAIKKKNKEAIAIGILIREDGSVLMSKRPIGKEASGFWEFPGGKVCHDETIEKALFRELSEEIGIQVKTFVPWLSRGVDSDTRPKILNFFKVYRWKGDPFGKEGQEICWQNPRDIKVYPILSANRPILKFLKLPLIYSITDVASFGEKKFLSMLDCAFNRGLRFVQVRDKQLPLNMRESVVRHIVEKAQGVGGVVIVNGDCKLARKAKANGVHLSSKMLLEATRRPNFEWCGASCHDVKELQKAIDLKLDFVVYGPVLPTSTHPRTSSIGWDLLEKEISNSSIPVYALGGLSAGMLRVAQKRGATGISMMGGSWSGKERLDVF